MTYNRLLLTKLDSVSKCSSGRNALHVVAVQILKSRIVYGFRERQLRHMVAGTAALLRKEGKVELQCPCCQANLIVFVITRAEAAVVQAGIPPTTTTARVAAFRVNRGTSTIVPAPLPIIVQPATPPGLAPPSRAQPRERSRSRSADPPHSPERNRLASRLPELWPPTQESWPIPIYLRRRRGLRRTR